MKLNLDEFSYRNGTLHAEKVPLDKIAQEVGTPCYVYSKKALLDSFMKFQKGLNSIDHLICFAVKSNSNLTILRLLHEAGAGMDIVSYGEFFRTLKAGIPPAKTVFSGVGKTEFEMRAALEQGVFSFNVESTEELVALNQVALSIGKQAPVALRFNPDVNPKTHPYISTGLKKNKFGMNLVEILKTVKKNETYTGIKIKGLSIHIGSQILSLAPVQEAFQKTKILIHKINSLLPEPLSFVDLGGGIGISYAGEKPPSIEKYCQLILKYFGCDLKVLIEPGRVITGNAGILLARGLYRKKRGGKDFFIIDAGMNDLMRPSLYQSHHEIIPVSQTKGPVKKTDIVGPICESADCFAHERKFPTQVDRNDWVAILSSGAYGFSMSNQYNSRPRPAEVLVDGAEYKIIRKRETFEDLIRGEVFS